MSQINCNHDKAIDQIMQRERLQILFKKYLSYEIDESELHEFLTLLNTCEDSTFDDLIEEEIALRQRKQLEANGFDKNKILNSILLNIGENEPEIKPAKSYYNSTWIAKIAASILLFVSIGYVIQINFKHLQNPDVHQHAQNNEISLPNQEEPILLRSDGKQFVISDENIQDLAKEGLEVTKDGKGNNVYKISEANSNSVVNRTLVSPKGTSIHLELADGTHIWLNSDASITYPDEFSQDIRKIELKGEAYLKVAHEQDRPFVVNVNGTAIEVLGTEFNVSPSLKNDKTITTLISGKVLVSVGEHKRYLKPGFQSISDQKNQTIDFQKADIKEVLAWREGYFRFNEDDIQTVLSKIKGWYDIQEFSINSTSNDKFSGMVRRTKKLTDLLNQLEKISNYKFKIQDGRVLVM